MARPRGTRWTSKIDDPEYAMTDKPTYRFEALDRIEADIKLLNWLMGAAVEALVFLV